MVNADRGESWKGRRKLPEVEVDAMSWEDVVPSSCICHVCVCLWTCIRVNTATWLTGGALQPNSPLLWPVRALTTIRKEVHMNVSRSSRANWASSYVPSQPLRWIVSDITPSPPHVEINGPALQHTVYPVWNCFYSRSVCCDNSTPIFLLYSNSCQIDKKHLRSPRRCWCCRWEPLVLFLPEKERAEEEVDGGMEIGVNMEI